MGRRVLRRHIWDYAVCLCPTKRTPGLNELSGVLQNHGNIAVLQCKQTYGVSVTLIVIPELSLPLSEK